MMTTFSPAAMATMNLARLRPLAGAALALLLATGCAVSPVYETPTAAAPTVYKEAAGWVQAAPADTLERGPWWTLFGDPLLNQLADSLEVNNQNVAAAVAAYDQARALVREQRAGLFPTVDASLSSARSGGKAASGTATSHKLDIGASWEPDVWGKLRASVNGATASAQASAAQLAAARLSAQGELAIAYFSLRQSDAQLTLLASTIEGYQRNLTITQNRFDAAIVTRSDVLQAQSTLYSAQIDLLTMQRTRAQYEHAIAILLGKAPADFTLAVAPWTMTVPEIPLGLPSTLLQRRPDIASAERSVAVANEQIGIARAAYFPTIGLSGSYGTGSSKIGDLLNASSSLWSFGLSATQSLFNAGATTAAVDAARAAHTQAVANYRQTVLTAFADVEDQLTATRSLSAQLDLRKAASQVADQVEAQMLNRYRAGQVSYSDVVTAQATALSARRSLVQAEADRQTTAVALIQSLGGGWHAEQGGTGARGAPDMLR